MTEFIVTHPWSCCMAWVLACAFVWSLCAIAGRADQQADEMFRRIRRVK